MDSLASGFGRQTGVPAGMVTETELEGAGVLTRSLHSRALIVKPLGQRPADVARS